MKRTKQIIARNAKVSLRRRTIAIIAHFWPPALRTTRRIRPHRRSISSSWISGTAKMDRDYLPSASPPPWNRGFLPMGASFFFARVNICEERLLFCYILLIAIDFTHNNNSVKKTSPHRRRLKSGTYQMDFFFIRPEQLTVIGLWWPFCKLWPLGRRSCRCAYPCGARREELKKSWFDCSIFHSVFHIF